MRQLRWGLVAAVALISCVPEITVEPPEAGTVTVTVASSTILQGGTTQATANAVDTRGRALTSEPRTWSSSNNSIATVSPTGLVTGVGAGTANISATVLGRAGSVAVTVAPPVASVQVTAPDSSIVRGQTVQLTATPRTAGGAVVTGRTVNWSSASPSVATVSTSGLVSAVGVGSAVITATVDGINGTLTITVATDVATVQVAPTTATLTETTPTQQYTATPRNAANTALTGLTVTWSSLDTTIATVSASGLVTAVRPGSTTIRATVDGVNGNATANVNVCFPTPYNFGPTVNGSLVSGDCGVAGGGVEDLFRSTEPSTRLIYWAMPQPTAAGQVSVLRELRPGVVTSDALPAGGGNFAYTVAGGGTTRFRIRTSGFALPFNYEFNVPASDPAQSASWPAAACRTIPIIYGSTTISVNRALAAGDCQSSSRLFHSWLVALQAGEQITVTQNSTAIDPIVYITQGGVDLASDNNSGGGVNARLVYTAPSTGNYEVRTMAAVAGTSGAYSATFTIAQAAVASVTVTSAATSVVRGQTIQYTATTRDASNNVLTGRTVTWSSDNTSIATVSATGVVTGVGVGSTTIRATSEGVQGTRAITVTTDVNAVVVTPSTFTLNAAGATQQLTADPRNASNVSLTGRTVTWSSLNTAVATVSASGLVTAVANGTATIRATVEGVIGQATATVNITVNPCTATAYTLGSTINGQVTTSDCLFETNFWEDRFSFSRASSAYITFPVTPSGGTVDLVTYTTQNSAGTGTPYFWTRFSAAGTANRLFGSGTFIFAVGNATTPPVSYSLSSSVATSVPPACQSLFTIIGNGISIGSSWDASSCTRLGKREGRFRVRLNAGQQITVGMSSTIDTYLELWATNADTVTTQVAFDDDGAGGTNSLMTYTASTGGFFEIKTTHFSSTAQTGTYTLTISTSPLSIQAPSLLSPSVNMGAPLMAPARHRGRQ
ncbi:Ig-like domain-containing protein [Pseudogemmatithrix spongiicola]|uniref:Ig-like domain-containing protein n=1 Tax=Pseudogemmatithrix spongiicola TaxID=3062599 RepID=A0AA49JYR0_9BACT|nr:Ig-like domain-containing protein [Gemmatimonadaceae bacterium 'strain 138']WKW14406.1 Ig-like domain-containing protein [Gemmatimonadaceae bacterium 'strain 318']